MPGVREVRVILVDLVELQAKSDESRDLYSTKYSQVLKASGPTM